MSYTTVTKIEIALQQKILTMLKNIESTQKLIANNKELWPYVGACTLVEQFLHMWNSDIISGTSPVKEQSERLE